MLPRPMQLHLLIVTNRRLFTDVALFKSCEPEVVAVCLRVMGQQICVPYERVLVKGEPPRALFIIRSGHVQVSKDVAVGEQGGGQSSGQGGGQGHASASASAGAPGNTRERTPRLSQCSVGGMQGVQGVQGIMKSGSSLSGGSSKSDMADKGNRSDTGDRSDTPSSADAKSRLAADFSLLYKQTHASNVITRAARAGTHSLAGTRDRWWVPRPPTAPAAPWWSSLASLLGRSPRSTLRHASWCRSLYMRVECSVHRAGTAACTCGWPPIFG